ncbi:MAG: YlxR family protein [Clostridia bacterium]|nr:YlxR family protein [Clostridia bacterium]
MTEKKLPERRCIGCMKSKPKQELVRIVADGNGLHIDPSGKMPGRGAYLCRNEECAKLALRKNAFGRNLKTEVSRQEAESIVEQIAQLSR